MLVVVSKDELQFGDRFFLLNHTGKLVGLK